ncbi:MAG: hypothetical protein MRZ79_23445 [Bacteroidia bacterium]|nr:hypothetical protein [Bacteroidia bacterium]
MARKWMDVEMALMGKFGKKLNLESILFLIGLRELGATPNKEFSKEEKVDLMHIAICRLLSQSGYYKLSHLDQDGWPHWELQKALPHQDMFSQEYLLREHILAYFENEGLFEE